MEGLQVNASASHQILNSFHRPCLLPHMDATDKLAQKGAAKQQGDLIEASS